MPTVGITVNFQGMAEGFSIEGFGMFYLTPSKNAGMIVYTEGQTYTAEINTGGKLYNVVAVRGCTISNIQDTTFNVVFTSDTATIRVYADNPSSIIGAYTLNQTLNKLGDDGQQYNISVSFTSDDRDMTGMQLDNVNGGWSIRYLSAYQPPVAYSENAGWTDQSYRLVDFGDTAQEVPAMFKDWVEENGSAIFTITKEATNASITAPLTAEKGSSVQFTVTPNAGYTVTSVLVVPLSGVSNVPTIDLGNGKYTFTMPGSDVEIRVTATVSSTNCTVTFDSGVTKVDCLANSNWTWTVSGSTVNISETDGLSKYKFQVTTDKKYTLSDVTGTGCTISDIDTSGGSFYVVFTDYTSSITVTSEQTTFDITKEATNASITASSTAKKGSNVQFTVTPNAGYTVTSVLVVPLSGVSNVPTIDLGNGKYTFTMPGSDVEIRVTATVSSTNCTVTFDEGVMSVTTTASSGGTWNVSGTAVNISGISTSGRYTFNVSLADGYTLSNVTGTGCTILSKAATSFVVGFSSTTSRISVVTKKEGVENYPIDWKYSNATLTGAVSSAEAGSPVSFSVLPANGYEVTGVTASANEAPLQVNVSGSSYYFVMPSAAVTVTVLTELAPQNTDLQVNFDSGVGYVSANINGGSYAFSDTGDSKEISYIPGAENAFTAALVNGYRISYVNGENCTISDINYAEGTFSVVFTGTPSTVNIGTQALEPETVEVSLAVMFDAGVSAVSTNVAGTTVSWTTSGGRQTFETQDGATRDFSISLVSGYYLDSVSGTGCTITAQTENGFSVLFTSTTPNVSIVTQRAAQISYPISYSYTSGTLNGPSSAEEGETVTFTFTPENGYTVGNVTVMGNTEIEVENSGNSYSFTMPAEPVAVSITVNTPDIITIQTLGVFKEEADKAYAPFNVVYAPATLTDEQQAQARENIGAVSETELSQALEPYALQNGTYPSLSAGHASTADRATGDENGNRIISFYGHDLTLSINPQTYVMTTTLVSEDGTVLATRSIDLPLESMVVSGTYDEATKEVVLTLQSGQQVRFSVADLVDGLASQAALDAETQAREAADAALAKDISDLQDGTTPVGVASKLATEDVGSAAKPVYFENGVPVACGDSLSADITGTANNADNLGGKPASYYILKSQIEYGVRFALDENGNMGSSPTGQRVIRYNGAVTEWSPAFTPNVGNGTSVPEINENDFDLIPLFSPKLWTDNAGNAFRRFNPFYWGRQVMGGYLYIWVCETPLYSFYRMPQAFIKDGKIGYRDIAVYEGAFETIGDVTYLCSKPGLNPAYNNTRTQFWQKAQAWQTYLSVDTNNEWYGITQISEITEILQPLVMIMFGTLNSQSVYKGVVSIPFNYYSTGVAVNAYDESKMTLYFSESALRYYRVGGTACINGTATSEDYYRQIIANGTVTGTVSGSTFTPSDDGETYYYITISGTSFPAAPTTVCASSVFTGETDSIEATSGTFSDNGLYSFKVFGIENIWGNIWIQILDMSIYNNVPMKLNDPYEFTEFSSSDYTQYYTGADYSVVSANGYITQIGWQPTMPDVQMPISVGGSTNTYYCDFVRAGLQVSTVYYGDTCASSTDGASAGLFCWHINNSLNYHSRYYGARLSHWALIEK